MSGTGDSTGRQGRSGKEGRAGRRLRIPTLGVAVVASAATAACGLAPAAWGRTDGSGKVLAGVSVSTHTLGLTPTPGPAPSPKTVAKIRSAAVSLPASVDLTPFAMPVGNQGPVGSCAAWATDYGALGYWENVQKVRGGGLEPMYTYSQFVNAYDGGRDAGSTIDYHLQVATQQGVDNQADYFQGNFDYKDVPTAAERLSAVNWRLSGYTDLPIQPSASSTVSQQSIEGALAAGNPVVIGIPVYWSFETIGTGNNGYYGGPSSNDTFMGYHAIVALGYNSQGLVIENSWGTGWGKAGYATLSWAFVNQYVFQATSVGRLVTGQPVNTVAPGISGTIAQGQVLTASAGTWSPSGSSYAYQWERAASGTGAWSLISGATSATYTPAAADVGNSLRVVVNASNATGKGAAASAVVGPVASGAPANKAAPAITGTLTAGRTLSATTGTWSPAGTSYAYQWQRLMSGSWVNVWSMTSSSYQLEGSDVGTSVRVQVTATNAYGYTYAWSAATGTVQSGAPVNSVAPAVSGSAVRGSVLSASTGTWVNAGPSYAYQWQRSASSSSAWTNIAGASAPTYTPTTADVGNRLRVQVMTANQFGSLTASSAATGTVAASPPVNTGPPKLSGAGTLGSTLSATAGTWTGNGNSYSYQWQRNAGHGFSAITGATSSTYRITSADQGGPVRVVVTAANPDGTANQVSNAVGVPAGH
jgi:Papain family cysteine protease/Ig domain of plant-specific actin-binding protein